MTWYSHTIAVCHCSMLLHTTVYFQHNMKMHLTEKKEAAAVDRDKILYTYLFI